MIRLVPLLAVAGEPGARLQEMMDALTDSEFRADLLWMVLGVVLSLVLAVAIHQLGHVLFGRLAGYRIRVVRFGRGPTLLRLRIGLGLLVVNALPVSGAVSTYRTLETVRWSRVLLIAGGCVANATALIPFVGWPPDTLAHPVLATLLIVQALAILNLVVTVGPGRRAPPTAACCAMLCVAPRGHPTAWSSAFTPRGRRPLPRPAARAALPARGNGAARPADWHGSGDLEGSRGVGSASGPRRPRAPTASAAGPDRPQSSRARHAAHRCAARTGACGAEAARYLVGRAGRTRAPGPVRTRHAGRHSRHLGSRERRHVCVENLFQQRAALILTGGGAVGHGTK